MRNPFIQARLSAERSARDEQERNRLWWEALPMTYKPWQEADRSVNGAAGFAALEGSYLASNPWLRENFQFSRFAGKRTLEIGCGAGAASALFARAGAAHTAIDLTEQAVTLTSEYARAANLTMRVSRMDAESLDFPDASFDHTFAWGVLHHSHDPIQCIREVARVLRPGGSGLIMVYNKHSLRYWLRGAQYLVLNGLIFRGHSLESVQSQFTDGYYHRHFSPRELRAIIVSCGLNPKTLSVSHMAGEYVPGMPRRLDSWLKRQFGWLLIVQFERPRP